MSVPVAGRRKGQSAPPSTASVPISAPPSVPSWLDGEEPTTTAPSLTSPITQTVADAASPALSVTTGSPNVFSPPAAVPPWEEESALPAFLRDGPPAQQPGQFPSSPQPSPVAQVGGGVASGWGSPAAVPNDGQQRQALAAELAALDQQLAAAAQRMEVLQGTHHPAATEVAELDKTLVSLRAKEAEGQQRRAERDAEVQRAMQAAASAVTPAADVASVAASYRVECQQRCEQELDALHTALHALETTNASLRSECEQAVTTTPEARCQATAMEALERRLQDGVRRLRQRFSQECSSAVARSARGFLAEARTQREAIFENDRLQRAAELESYRQQRAASMTVFYDECHTVHQQRADAAFGSLKVSFDRRGRQGDGERERRLAAFRAQLRAVTERCHETVELQLRTRAERDGAIVAAQREGAAKELALRAEDLARQRRAFRARAEAEVAALEDAHGPSPSLRAHSSDTASPSTATAASLPALHADVDQMRTQLQRLLLSLHTKQQQQQQQQKSLSGSGTPWASGTAASSGSTTPPSRASLPHRTSKGALSLEAAQGQWRESLLDLQRSRGLLQRTVDDLASASHSCADKVQRGRQRLTQLRDGAQAVQMDWERSVRAQLSSCLTAHSVEVPPVASLTTGTLSNLSTHVARLRSQQGVLRTSRLGFAAQMEHLVRSVADYRSRSERGLSTIFAQYEELRGASAQAEVEAVALQTLRTHVATLHRQVSAEAHRLAAHKRALDSVIEQMRAGEQQVEVPSLRRTRECVPHGQSTQIFSPSPSPLVDVTNSTRHRTNCDRRGEAVRTPEKAIPAAPSKRPPVAATAQHRLLSSATTPSFATTAIAEKTNSDVAPSRHATSSHVAPTTIVSAGSAAELFGSDSPSPIMPSLEGHSGWVQQYGAASGGGGPGAYISVSPQTEDAGVTGQPSDDSEGPVVQ